MENAPKSKSAAPPKSSAKVEKDVPLSPLRRTVSGVLETTISSERTSAVPKFGQELTNYKQLVARAIDVFGDELKASEWLSVPNADLNGNTPLQVAQQHNYEGQVLEPLFIRIEHGIYF